MGSQLPIARKTHLNCLNYKGSGFVHLICFRHYLLILRSTFRLAPKPQGLAAVYARCTRTAWNLTPSDDMFAVTLCSPRSIEKSTGEDEELSSSVSLCRLLEAVLSGVGTKVGGAPFTWAPDVSESGEAPEWQLPVTVLDLQGQSSRKSNSYGDSCTGTRECIPYAEMNKDLSIVSTMGCGFVS